MIKTSQLFAVLFVFAQTTITLSLCFKSTGFDSESGVVPYYKQKLENGLPVYEDRAISTKKLLMVSDGVGGSEYPSGPLADTLVSEITSEMYKNWNIFNVERLPVDIAFNLNLKKTLLTAFVGRAVNTYNGYLDSLGIDKRKATSATLAGSIIEDIKGESYYTVFQYGDSLTMILRKKETSQGTFMCPFLVTQSQQKQFNQPYQVVSFGDSIRPKDIRLFERRANLHDIVLVGSDGIFDNFPNALIGIAVNYTLMMLQHHVKRFNNLDKFNPRDVLKELIDDYVKVIQPYESLYHIYVLIKKAKENRMFKIKPSDENYPFMIDSALYDSLIPRIKSSPIGPNTYKLTASELIELRFNKANDSSEYDKQINDLITNKKEDKADDTNMNQNTGQENSVGDKEEKLESTTGSKASGDDKENSVLRSSALLSNLVDTKTKQENPIEVDLDDEPSDEFLEIKELNFFSIHGCAIFDFFEDKSGDNEKLEVAECIAKILKDMHFDMELIEKHYNPQLVASAMAHGVKYLYENYPDVYNNFGKGAAIMANARYIKSKSDDIGISMSLVVEDTAKDELEDIEANIELRRKNTLNELESYELSSDSKGLNKLI